MSTAENVTWEDHWLTSGERRALRALEASQRPQESEAVSTVVSLVLKRRKAKRQRTMQALGILAGGLSIPMVYALLIWCLAP